MIIVDGHLKSSHSKALVVTSPVVLYPHRELLMSAELEQKLQDHHTLACNLLPIFVSVIWQSKIFASLLFRSDFAWTVAVDHPSNSSLIVSLGKNVEVLEVGMRTWALVDEQIYRIWLTVASM